MQNVTNKKNQSNIIPFPLPTKKKWIPLPANARVFDNFDEYAVFGDMLEGVGIFNGNLLTCRTNFDFSEITPKTVCVVRVLETNEMTAKMVRFSKNKVTLIGANPQYKPETYLFDDVEILAVAVEVRRVLEVNQ